MYTELFRKVRKEVERELSENPNSFLKDAAERAMNKYLVPTEERETFLHALSRKMKTEKIVERQEPKVEETKKETDEKQKMFSKEIWRKIQKGAGESEINYEFEEGLLDGTIAKEDLENSRFIFKGKKVEEFPFGPPR